MAASARIVPWAAAALLLLATGAARANHTVFDYPVERFQADGNVFGGSSADSAFAFLDEFDDGVVSTFHKLFGTVTEEGGAMHLKSPGTHFSLNFPWTLDQTDAVSDATMVQEGSGSGVYRVTWAPTSVGVNHYLHVSFWAGSEIVGLALTNFDESISSLYDPPYPMGLQMTAHHERFENFGITGVSLEHQALDTITGAMIFELRYDDTTRTVTVDYSVDGGATFHGGFASMSIGFAPDSHAGGTLIVGADPYLAPEPPPPNCPLSLLLDKMTLSGMNGRPNSGKVTLHARIGNDILDPANQGMELLLVDMGSGNQIPWATNIPPGGPGTGCDPRDGWTTRSGHAKYRNVSGDIPPFCYAGSAAGVTKILTRPALTDLAVTARRTSLPAIVGPVVLMYQNPATAEGQCDQWLSAQTFCRARGSRLRCP